MADMDFKIWIKNLIIKLKNITDEMNARNILWKYKF